MANNKHLAILNKGVKTWNEWRETNPKVIPDLSDANLSGRNLTRLKMSPQKAIKKIIDTARTHSSKVKIVVKPHERKISREERRCIKKEMLRNCKLKIAQKYGCNFSGANLHGANLEKSVLIGASLENALITKSQLSAAVLPWANLRSADLCGARLIKANLQEADLNHIHSISGNFERALLQGASIRQASLVDASFYRANLTGVDLTHSYLLKASFAKAKLKAANLLLTTLVGTGFQKANLTGCHIYGISAWDVDTEGALQSDLLITPGGPIITVDNLEVAQFIYLLLHNSKIRDIIDTCTSKVVLILGRFTLERKQVLDAIKEELRKRDYVPVMFDFERPVSRDFTETIKTLAHLARFIIADLTDARCIPQELQAIVPAIKVPLKPLVLEGKNDPWTMFKDFALYPWVLKTTHYRDIADLLASFQKKIIQPAERKSQQLTIKKVR